MSWTRSLPRRVASRDRGPRAAAARRSALAVLPVLLLGLGACRSDSLVAPGTPDCTAGACDPPPAEQGVTPAVLAPLSDATGRILAGVTDRTANVRLTAALRLLEADLAAGRIAGARLRVAEAYDLLDELERTAGGALHPDAPELAAIRLSLVPAARAVGVYAP